VAARSDKCTAHQKAGGGQTDGKTAPLAQPVPRYRLGHRPRNRSKRIYANYLGRLALPSLLFAPCLDLGSQVAMPNQRPPFRRAQHRSPTTHDNLDTIYEGAGGNTSSTTARLGPGSGLGEVVPCMATSYSARSLSQLHGGQRPLAALRPPARSCRVFRPGGWVVCMLVPFIATPAPPCKTQKPKHESQSRCCPIIPAGFYKREVPSEAGLNEAIAARRACCLFRSRGLGGRAFCEEKNGLPPPQHAASVSS
jgi:hypothetical protein